MKAIEKLSKAQFSDIFLKMPRTLCPEKLSENPFSDIFIEMPQ